MPQRGGFKESFLFLRADKLTTKPLNLPTFLAEYIVQYIVKSIKDDILELFRWVMPDSMVKWYLFKCKFNERLSFCSSCYHWCLFLTHIYSHTYTEHLVLYASSADHPLPSFLPGIFAFCFNFKIQQKSELFPEVLLILAFWARHFAVCFRAELALWFSPSFRWECQTCLTRNSGFLVPLIAPFAVQNNKKCYQIQQFKCQRFILFIRIFCLGACCLKTLWSFRYVSSLKILLFSCWKSSETWVESVD